MDCRNEKIFDDVPDEWQTMVFELKFGELGTVNPAAGLIAMAQMLCAGDIRPPWTFGLSLVDFSDTFEIDMGFRDAFRLWIMCCFDDDKLLRELLAAFGIPDAWADWMHEQSCLD